jgi:hypothetical protein
VTPISVSAVAAGCDPEAFPTGSPRLSPVQAGRPGHPRQWVARRLQSGMASVAERVTALALGEQPKLRVIEGNQRAVRQPLDEPSAAESEQRASA